MNNYISLNSKTLMKILKRYQLTTRGKWNIIEAAKKNFIQNSSLNKLAIKIEFKKLNTIKNKQL